jgi:hypothetical protein
MLFISPDQGSNRHIGGEHANRYTTNVVQK